MTQPYDFFEAVEKSREQAERQKAAEDWVVEAGDQFATATKNYREALAKEIVKQHAEGAAWTVAQDLARGAPYVAELGYLRDVAKSVYDAAEQAGWRHTANRKDQLEFIQWSKRVAPDGQREVE